MSDWTHIIQLNEAPMSVRLVADDAARKAIARTLDLLALDELDANVSVKPWFDGVEISAAWTAHIAQTCGVSLERLDQDLAGAFTVRAVPPGSVHAPDTAAIAIVDPEADDPPDIVEGGAVDMAHYVVEHLALEIDPFPRKPGAAFTPPDTSAEISPFSVLRRLRQED